MTVDDAADGYFMTELHHRLRAEVRSFAESVVQPGIAYMERSGSVDHVVSRLIAETGWVGVTVGPEYGGMGLGHLAKTLVIEELARVSGAMGAMVQASQLGVAKILHFGNQVQKNRWLPAIAAGRCLPTFAVAEPCSGGHVLGTTSTAHRDGDHYVLNGRKAFVGNSHIGDVHGVVARTGPGSRGLSAFLVEATSPGFTLPEHGPVRSLPGFSVGELMFENCRVPVENLLGAEGDGLAIAYSSSILYGQPNLTAVALGTHQAIVEQTLRFTQDMNRAGRQPGESGAVQLKLGHLNSELMTARLLAYHAAHLLDQGMACDAELMNAKLANVQLSLNAAHTAMEVHAAYGSTAGPELQRFVRDAQLAYVPTGTSDVQRLRHAEVVRDSAQHQWSLLFAGKVRSSGAELRRRLAAAPVGGAEPAA